MKLASIEAVIRALNDASVPYLIAGGLAVNAHGYGRATYDIDLVVRLDQGTVEKLFAALASLGYKPLVPIRPDEFADRAVRERWIVEKGAVVLQFASDRHRDTRVDVFLREPFDFEAEYARAFTQDVAPGLAAPFVRLATLIRMKEAAGRLQDLADLEHLRWIAEESAGDE